MKRYLIKEIFGPTIQGEGRHAGLPVLFLRFAGCNRWSGREKDKENSICKFCDTDFFGGTRMTAREIATSLQSLSSEIKAIVISGGEATIQLDKELLTTLLEHKHDLMLETNGSNPLGDLEYYFEHVTMSPKQSLNETKLERCDDLKILYPYISDEITLEAFKDFEASQRWLQPVEPLDNKELHLENIQRTVQECLRKSAKLSLQIHKIINVK